MTLPPIDMSIVKVAFSDAEREFYSALLERSQSVFEGFIKSGVANKSYIQIFSLLQRLRQACDHVSLVVQNNVDTDSKCTTGQSMDDSDVAVGDNTLSNKVSTLSYFFLFSLHVFHPFHLNVVIY